ncbi:NUDIX domain-containing protein [Lentilitoribacter sp. EG35]|uniref:NUDIX domain-containing protein n=1 Tax=Lentilitoribacter sp. EG35 TaxID=3234192 RepID=UPI003460226A
MSKTKHNRLDIVGYRFGQVLRRLNIPSLYIARLFQVWHKIKRPMTLGVRIAAFNDQDEVFLVRHTYVDGWHFPGGGVERNQTMLQAMRNELREEGNLVCISDPKIIGMFHNKRYSNRDHVAFYSCQVEQIQIRLPDAEIAESGFFNVDKLPESTTKPVLARLAELKGEQPISEIWS